MTALTNVLLPEGELPGAVPEDIAAMAPHIAHMHKMIDIATARPNDFYYAVVVVGKDGLNPAIHGTLYGGLLSVTGALFASPQDSRDITLMHQDGLTTPEIFDVMATCDRPEFWDVNNGEDGNLTIGGDVAGPQPQSLDDVIAELKAAGFAVIDFDAETIDGIAQKTIEGDLNGDGVVDEKDEVLRLAQLADDGNPHSGE